MERNMFGSKFPLFPRMVLAFVLLTCLSMLLQSPSGSGAAPAGRSNPVGLGTGNVAYASSESSTGAPQATCPSGGQCFADVTSGNPFYAFVNRIYQQDLVTGYPCGGTSEPCDQFSRPYYRPLDSVTRQQMAKFIDNARRLPEINITTSTDASPVVAISTAPNSDGITASGTRSGVWADVDGADTNAIFAEQDTHDPSAHGAAVRADADTADALDANSVSGYGLSAHSTSSYGVYAASTSGAGVRGISQSAEGIQGESNTSTGVGGSSSTSYGVRGSSFSNDGVHGDSGSGNGVYGTSTSGNAGYFDGNVVVTGTCTGCLGTYTIDDPLDPANKYLNQAGVASSQMLDLYTGHVTLGANGEAWVDMPSWFQSLNEDFDYQLTCVGGYAPVYIAQEIANNRFEIAGGKPGMKVSWQVTGTRHDPYAEEHPVQPEQNKPASAQGTYLHPELYGQPDSKTVPPGK